VMTGCRSEVYSIQLYVIVCDDWRPRKLKVALSTTLTLEADQRVVLNTTLCDRVCDVWRQVRGVLNTTLCDRVCDVLSGGMSDVYSVQPYVIVCNYW